MASVGSGDSFNINPYQVLGTTSPNSLPLASAVPKSAPTTTHKDSIGLSDESHEAGHSSSGEGSAKAVALGENLKGTFKAGAGTVYNHETGLQEATTKAKIGLEGEMALGTGQTGQSMSAGVGLTMEHSSEGAELIPEAEVGIKF